MSVVGDDLYALCYVQSKWWQFWKPRTYKLLVRLTPADLDIVKTLA